MKLSIWITLFLALTMEPKSVNEHKLKVTKARNRSFRCCCHQHRDSTVHKGTAAFTENRKGHDYGPFPRAKRGLKLLHTHINTSSICEKQKLVLSLPFPFQHRVGDDLFLPNSESLPRFLNTFSLSV